MASSVAAVGGSNGVEVQRHIHQYAQSVCSSDSAAAALPTGSVLLKSGMLIVAGMESVSFVSIVVLLMAVCGLGASAPLAVAIASGWS